MKQRPRIYYSGAQNAQKCGRGGRKDGRCTSSPTCLTESIPRYTESSLSPVHSPADTNGAPVQTLLKP